MLRFFASAAAFALRVQYPTISLSQSAFYAIFLDATLQHSYMQFTTMAPKRKPLGEISGNIPRRKELTPIQRAEIIGASKCSVKPAQIAKDLSVPRTTIYTTIGRALQRNNYTTCTQTSRTREYTRYHERILLRVVRQFPKYTYKQLRAFSGLKMHASTIR